MRGCIQCGECLNVCPVFRRHRREEYSPKGKRLLLEPFANQAGVAGKGAAWAAGLTWDDVFTLARLCAGCGRCQEVCARNLSTADLLADVRAAHPHWTQHLWEMWIHHMGPLWPTVGFLAALAPRGLAPRMLESSLATAGALAKGKNILPWVRLVPPAASPGIADHTGEKAVPVAVFSGCTARNVRPQWTAKAEALLRAAGHTVPDAASFTCCGGTMHHAGRYAAMNAMRRANADAWRAMGGPRVAVFCASCFHSLEAYPDDCFDGEEALAWRRSLVPLSALLAPLRAEVLDAKPASYGYHQPCHWAYDADMPFLSRIMPGLRQGGEICCGMGGILKMTDPDLSASMARTCLAGMPEGAARVLTGCSGCAMQLSAFAPEGVAVRHWLDVIAVE